MLRLGLEQRNIYLFVYTCLHTGDSTTPLLSAQRVSPLRFVGINKQSFILFVVRTEGKPKQGRGVF